MQTTNEASKDKPPPWLCDFCGEHMIYHRIEGNRIVCPEKNAAALGGKKDAT